MRLALGVEYDGGAFSGYQQQSHAASVQQTLQQALSQIADHPIQISAAGRTDAGVHALAQVASFSLQAPIPAANLQRALNHHLPPSIRVAINQVFAAPDTPLRPGDEVAFLPPITGG